MGHSLRAGGEQLNTTRRSYAHTTGELTSLALEEHEYFFAAAERKAEHRADA
jgi:hypothetical protein